MSCLEIIEMRSGHNELKVIEPQMTELVNELNQGAQDYSIKLYVNAKVENDFSIHILHKSNGAVDQESALGSNLLSILKEFGLTHYSIWIERTTKLEGYK